MISRLEEFAKANPRGYVVRVGLLASLGYVYLFTLLLVVVLGTLLIVTLMVVAPNAATIKLGAVGIAILLGLAWAILKALWVRIEPPQGLELRREDVPVLFELIDELKTALRTSRLHHVLLTDEFNAGVAQRPRLGVLGWQENYLLLGLPLLQTLSPDEFRAVLAHEFGHLSGNHSRFGAWIYRVRQTWVRLFEQFERQGQTGTWAFTKFINWYAPFFDAYSFVLARANEYEADRCSARVAGAENAARALIRTQVFGRHIGEVYWPDVFRRANTEPSPPTDLFGDLAKSLRRGPTDLQTSKWLREACLECTTRSNTHPCLTDRLLSLGQATTGDTPLVLPPPPVENAADYFLGPNLPNLQGQLEKSWREHVEPHWNERYKQAQDALKKLQLLETQSVEKPPTMEEKWERASLTMDLRGDDAALPLLREILAMDADHPPSNYLLGRILVDRNDVAGVAHLERAIAKEADAVLGGLELLYGYYHRQGQHDSARECEDRAERHQEVLARANLERANVTAKDTFLPAQISSADTDALQRLLASYPEVAVGHLVRKQVSIFPEKPLFLLAVTIKSSWYKFRSSEANQKIVNAIASQLKLPGQFLVFVPSDNLASLGKKIAQVPGAEIYRRK